MSVKGKVKRLNRQIEKLNCELIQLETLKNNNKRIIEDYSSDLEKIKIYENIIKFAITNHLGNLRGGMRIERYEIDKMQNLRLDIDYQPEFNSYIIRVNY
jgi:hypothetical protein